MSPNDDFIPNDDQHICDGCDRSCDCGAVLTMAADPDGYSDECLGCLDCIDTLRAADTEFRAERAASGLTPDWSNF